MKLQVILNIILLSTLLVLLGVLFTSWWIETKVLFNPSRDIIWIPSRNDYNYDNVFVDNTEGTMGVRINLWHFKFNPNNPVVLFCHGNSGNISNRGYIIDFCKQYRLNLVLFDYRGYGLSSGHRPSIQSILDDGITAYQYTSQYYSPENIIVWGESLGGSVAIYIASRCKCRSLLLMSTFSSLDDIVRYDPDFPWWLSGPLSVLIKNILGNLPSKEYIKNVKCPVVIIHSPKDDVIPYRCGKILYQSIPHDNKLFLDIDGKHSGPIISYDVLCNLFKYCNLNVDEELRGYTEVWLNNLQKVSKIHMLR
jgi:pimeloyl-ACP methyl ester carboxylesterase